MQHKQAVWKSCAYVFWNLIKRVYASPVLPVAKVVNDVKHLSVWHMPGNTLNIQGKLKSWQDIRDKGITIQWLLY